MRLKPAFVCLMIFCVVGCNPGRCSAEMILATFHLVYRLNFQKNIRVHMSSAWRT